MLPLPPSDSQVISPNHEIEAAGARKDATCTASRHAYCIMAHNDPLLLRTLIEMIDDERNDIYVMVDVKTDISIFSGITAVKSRLIWCNRRIHVYWGDVSQIQNEINLFKEAYKGNYSYYHLLSGADLPIKSQNEIHAFFAQHQGTEFIHISEKPNVPGIMHSKLAYRKCLPRLFKHRCRAVEIGARCIRMVYEFIQKLTVGKRKYAWPEMKYGSNWVSVTHDFVGLLLSNEKLVMEELSATYCSDEVYKQTVAWHSVFRNSLSQDGCLREIDWTRGGPYVWRNADYDELMHSRNLFARKFSSSVDRDIICRLRDKVLGTD